MANIPITRSLFLLPFLGILDEVGAPTGSLLEKFRLPANLDEQNNFYVPLLPALSFVEAAQNSQGISDLSFLAGQRLHFSHLREKTKALITHSPTLLVALRHACYWAAREDSILSMWLEYDYDHVRLCNRVNAAGDLPYLKHAQWLQNIFSIYIIRQFTGSNWMPPEMAFEANYTPPAETQTCWPSVRFLANQHASWVSIPVSHLSLSSQSNLFPPTSPRVEDELTSYETIEILKMMLPSYLDGKVPTLAEIADMAGVSARTFQRKLSTAGFVYSDILDTLRFERSSTLLRNTDSKLIDIAFASGYSDPAHFSRAFRRITGVTPRAYRSQSRQ